MSNSPKQTVRRPGHHKAPGHNRQLHLALPRVVRRPFASRLRLMTRPQSRHDRLGRRRPSSTDPTGPAPATSAPSRQTDNRSDRCLHPVGASPICRPVSRMHLPEAPQPNDGFSFPGPSPTEPTASTLGDLNPRHRPGSTAARSAARPTPAHPPLPRWRVTNRTLAAAPPDLSPRPPLLVAPSPSTPDSHPAPPVSQPSHASQPLTLSRLTHASHASHASHTNYVKR